MVSTNGNGHDNSHALVPDTLAYTAPQQSWNDGYNEMPYNPGGGRGDYDVFSGVMLTGMLAPQSDLASVLNQIQVKDPWGRIYVEKCFNLGDAMLRARCFDWPAELDRLACMINAVQYIKDSMDLPEREEDDKRPILLHGLENRYGHVPELTGMEGLWGYLPDEWDELDPFVDDCLELRWDIQKRIETAKRRGIMMWDKRPLIKWMNTPIHQRLPSPMPYLNNWHQKAFVYAAVYSPAFLAHIESTLARQVALIYGGDPAQNEITRWRNNQNVHTPAPVAPAQEGS